MPKSWATSADGSAPVPRTAPAAFGTDLHLELSGVGVRAGLMDALREAVRSGRLVSGTRLPSSRSLAADLGVARNTVADAYSELVAEGWLTARQGSGTRVARRAEPRTAAPAPPRTRPTRRSSAYSLMPGMPDHSRFPRKQWLASARRALIAAPHESFACGDALGGSQLRTAVADYLARARGVYATPERVVICTGFHHGLTLLSQVLKARGVRSVAVESYGLDIHRRQLRAAGLRTEPLSVDEQGTRTDDLAGLGDVGAVLMTPSHQFPRGVALDPDRRAAAVGWARARGGLILEDDYDGEFRYDRQPVGALQGLDPERVVYIGTASKSLATGLRLAWMVPLENLIPDIVAAKWNADWMSSAFEQLTLAEFIGSGAYERHVRSMRTHYRRRRDQLVAALRLHAPGIRVTGIAAGLHAVLELPPGTERSVIEAAARQGLAVSGMQRFRYSTSDPVRDALVIGYATPSDSAWTGALDVLCRVLP